MKQSVIMYIIQAIVLLSPILAQPAFPNTPNQAPIGGLGLLAAAGGAMALKKLLDRNKERDKD